MSRPTYVDAYISVGDDAVPEAYEWFDGSAFTVHLDSRVNGTRFTIRSPEYLDTLIDVLTHAATEWAQARKDQA